MLRKTLSFFLPASRVLLSLSLSLKKHCPWERILSSSEAKNVRMMRHSKTHARVVPKFSAIDCIFHCVCEYDNIRTSKTFQNLIEPTYRTYIKQ